jgi:hypothetical protein
MCRTDQEARSPCKAGWYTSPLVFDWEITPIEGSKPTEPCEDKHTYPADTKITLWCQVSWPSSFTLINYPYTVHVELSTPTATAVPARPPDANGWYNHPVAISYAGSAFSGIASCTPASTYFGSETTSVTVTGSCTDNAGKMAAASLTLSYDSTPPTIAGAIPSRPPDFHGWYNHPVTFVFTGTDATAGIEGCSAITYAGPDSANAQAVGSCRDKAGNSSSLAVPLRYQATPPELVVEADAGDGSVLLRWRSSADVEIVRSPGLHGRAASAVYRGGSGSFHDIRAHNGVSYKYTLTARDQAGNVTVRTVSVIPGPRLLAPVPNARLSAPPLLRWTPVRRARYYNVQLYRGPKILTVWPAHASLRLKRAWRFDGRLYRLTPGRYRWYVWPGFGSRAAARYGSLVGRGRFVVAP